jgi:hypothetical protein
MSMDTEIQVADVNGSLLEIYFEPVPGAVRPIAHVEYVEREHRWVAWDAQGSVICEDAGRYDTITTCKVLAEVLRPRIFAEFERQGVGM